MAKLRTFLVVIDSSPEMSVALRYAVNRAKSTGGRVAMLHVIEPQEIQTWPGIQQMFSDEEIAAAKTSLREHEKIVEKETGHKPVFFIKRGDLCDALLELLEKQPDISVLVLGASTGPKGPGPLVNYLTSAKGMRKLKIPLIMVPDTYSCEGGQEAV